MCGFSSIFSYNLVRQVLLSLEGIFSRREVKYLTQAEKLSFSNNGFPGGVLQGTAVLLRGPSTNSGVLGVGKAGDEMRRPGEEGHGRALWTADIGVGLPAKTKWGGRG